ncbi:secreted protein [methanotrophic bacterial endosymbiont of Bathymodiolus sp.]|nr:secreted protein [methanotrophic bacterial endosymbiont of Bathymodiolus sp.]
MSFKSVATMLFSTSSTGITIKAQVKNKKEQNGIV